MKFPLPPHPWHEFGGPAFPSDLQGLQFKGMTLRDWFAATASEFDVQCALEHLGRSGGLKDCRTSMDRNATARMACADAMLKARQA